MNKVLSIAGSDSGGGAGIQADLKTFAAHGVYGMTAITAVTAQNTCGVAAVQAVGRDMVGQQLTAVFEDIAVDAVKIGMVCNRATIEVIAERLKQYRARRVVLDPVMIATSGDHLLEPAAEQCLTEQLLPLAAVVTPNIPEAERLTGLAIADLAAMEKAARAIAAMGARQVLVKGGHLTGEAVDVLFDGRSFHHFSGKRIATKHTHGTGCTLSAAIAANLARGLTVVEAIAQAKAYVAVAIEHSLVIGHGAGPTHHFYQLYEQAGLL